MGELMSQHGYVDVCLQSHVAGWAIERGAPATLEVFVNDEMISRFECALRRPELAQFNIPPDAGFIFHFPSPLVSTDEVSIRFGNGKQLENSPTRQHRRHLEQILYGIEGGAGLEFGALDRPTISRERYNVSFVDHATRDQLALKYNDANNLALVDPSRIVHVDYIWSSGSLDEAVAGRRFSWGLASGVIEHVGDPIGWLAEIATVIEPGGRINLAIPEKTLTFDHARRVTTLAELLEDHHRGLKRPCFRHIFDHIVGVSPIGTPPENPSSRAEAVKRAYIVAERFEQQGLYADVHAHVWTHDSWRETWSAIETLGLAPLRVDKAFEPLPETAMFVVSFVRL